MVHRKVNGEGTIYRRKDGRYEGAAYFLTTGGMRKRVRVYGQTWQETHDKLASAKTKAQAGVPIPSRNRKISEYLDYWLNEVVKPNRRPATFARYELVVRIHLKPALGRYSLATLTAPVVQTFLNKKLADGCSIRNVQIMREVLSAALTRAMREELTMRNVARLVELPTWQRPEYRHWNAEEAKLFLETAQTDQLYPAFILLVLYGLRRGEVLGLRWCDVDFSDSRFQVRQQVQRISGELLQGPVKTKAGQRDLPLVRLLHEALLTHRGCVGGIEDDLIFTTRSGQPIEPRNFVRSFHRIREEANLPRIRVHDVRHTAATLLKNLGIPARDAQLILGHSTVTITQEIYQHDDMESRVDALERVEQLFTPVESDGRSRQNSPSDSNFVAYFTSFTSGRGDRTRTCDTRFWSSINSSVHDRAAEVNRVMNERRRCWLVGLVAVNLAVRTEQFHSDPPFMVAASNPGRTISSEVIHGETSLPGNGVGTNVPGTVG